MINISLHHDLDISFPLSSMQVLHILEIHILPLRRAWIYIPQKATPSLTVVFNFVNLQLSLHFRNVNSI
jgi:hypothetical protein